MNDVKLDAYYLVLHMLTMFFNNSKRIQYDQLETFFGEFATYFEPDDVTAFLKEV
jgi:hypothetical protein